MSLFWSAGLLFLWQTIVVCELYETDDPADVMNRTTDYYARPVDFRCHKFALKDFDDFTGDDFKLIGYAAEIAEYEDRIGCSDLAAAVVYPEPTGLDPMMPFYINKLHYGFRITPGRSSILGYMTPIERMKEYCAFMQRIAPAYIDFWERFQSDSDTCRNIMETVKNCYIFRQIRDMYVSKLHSKLCLDEDGCYNVMKIYDDDLPYCVKYMAISQFKNSSIGSWHHTIVNYCKLTEMVPEAKVQKYDRSILIQNGRTKENLREMCLYLRYRLLPEQGREQEIPDDAIDKAEYETLDTETTTGTEYENGASIAFAMGLWWNIISLITYRKTLST